MGGKKRPGNAPKLHRRPHKSLRKMWAEMRRRYQEHYPMWYAVPFPEQEHKSTKPEEVA